MGNSHHRGQFNSQTTAKQVVEAYGKDDYLSGKTAVVTGGNAGLGLETVKSLASAGARVVLCTRSIEAAKKAIEDEIKNPGFGNYAVQDVSNIVVRELDLNSLKSIKKFTDEINKSEPRIDYLILNAGIMMTPHLEHTEDGFEKQIGVNHFGHFYLYRNLEEKLQKQDFESRVVVLSSKAHGRGKLDYDDLHYEHRRYSPLTCYGSSKLANILFAKEVADRNQNTKVRAFSVHPGVIHTNLSKHVGASFPSFARSMVGWFFFDKDIPQGAATTVYACLAPELSEPKYRGVYLSDCAVKEPYNAQGRDLDGKERRRLWEVTEEQIHNVVKE